jgi:hypothetical protein
MLERESISTAVLATKQEAFAAYKQAYYMLTPRWQCKPGIECEQESEQAFLQVSKRRNAQHLQGQISDMLAAWPS